MKHPKTPKSANKNHSITIHLSNPAYLYMLGRAAYDGYTVDELEDMVRQDVAESVASVYESPGAEKKIFEAFDVA